MYIGFVFLVLLMKKIKKKKCGQFLALYKVCETKYLKVCDKCNLIWLSCLNLFHENLASSK